MLAVESEASREAVAAYQGEALVDHMSEAACGFLTALARVKPLVLVFDDLHWADEASLQLLRKASELVASQPLLFICMLRPEREAPSWAALQEVRQGLVPRCTSMELQPLASEQTSALLMNLLGMQDLPARLRALIVEKAGGNPFFIEELIRSLIETRQIVREDGHWRAGGEASVTVPDTLRGVLDARIDRLPEAERHTLQ